MRAIIVRKYGPPEVLHYGEWPAPEPRAGEVLIRVRAAGLNFADILARLGYYGGTPRPPFVPGLEIAGVVESVAAGSPTPLSGTGEARPLRHGGAPSPPLQRKNETPSFQAGDRVAALTMFRGYAELAAVPAAQVFALPPEMSFEEAAATPVNYLTAYHSLFEMGNLRAGDRALIHGAAGGCGVAAVQLCRARGITVFGTASASKQDYLRSIGVEHAIDYTREDFVARVRSAAPDGIELALDAVGGKSFTQSARCLGPGGRLIVYGMSTVVGPEGKRDLLRAAKGILQTRRYHPLKLIDHNLAVIGVHIGRMRGREALLRREMKEILEMYARGEIKPVVGKTFPLEQAADAHRFIHNRQNIGKVILTLPLGQSVLSSA
jgi:NADPH:quinone reductase-like Zn-dependent oxidoreductase